MTQYNVIISSSAKLMLATHVRFLAKVSVSAARELKTEILKAIRSLGTMPKRFPFLDVEFIPPNKYHKMCIGNRYLMLYQIKDQTVYVDYILDCRQDYGWLLSSIV